MTDTYLRIRTLMEEAHANYEREVKLYAEVRRILAEKFTGKRVDTKHTINYITKVQPLWHASFEHLSNHVNLRVWPGWVGGQREWNDHSRFMLGYDSELHTFDPALMDKHNMSVENAKREIESIEKFLAHPTAMQQAAQYIDAYKNVTETTKEFLGNCPEHYTLERMAGLRKD